MTASVAVRAGEAASQDAALEVAAQRALNVSITWKRDRRRAAPSVRGFGFTGSYELTPPQQLLKAGTAGQVLRLTFSHRSWSQ